MKKTLVTILAVSLFAASATTVSATSTTTPASAEALIAQLQAQIAELTAKLNILKQAQQEVKTAQKDVKGTLQLINGLREGMSGEQVKLLQTILAADSSIYPEQKITGYYGKMTREAVKHFQKKHGLEETGYIGAKTKKELNDVLENSPLHTEDNEDKDGDNENKRKQDGRICLMTPPGHIIAPGWNKNREDDDKKGKGSWSWDDLNIARCKKAPKNGTTTPPTIPDTTTPIISALSSANVSSTSANVLWTTNESATSKVYYATATPVDLGIAQTVSTSTLSLSHNLTLSGLTASTTYYVVAESKDAANNTATSSEISFITPL